MPLQKVPPQLSCRPPVGNGMFSKVFLDPFFSEQPQLSQPDSRPEGFHPFDFLQHAVMSKSLEIEYVTFSSPLSQANVSRNMSYICQHHGMRIRDESWHEPLFWTIKLGGVNRSSPVIPAMWHHWWLKNVPSRLFPFPDPQNQWAEKCHSFVLTFLFLHCSCFLSPIFQHSALWILYWVNVGIYISYKDSCSSKAAGMGTS